MSPFQPLHRFSLWSLKDLFGKAYEIAGVGTLLANKQTLAALCDTGDLNALPPTWQRPV